MQRIVYWNCLNKETVGLGSISHVRVSVLCEGVRLKFFKIMKDKEILEEVYRRLCWTTDNWHQMNMDKMFDRVHDMKDMIEQEWQNEDYKEMIPAFTNSWNKKDKYE